MDSSVFISEITGDFGWQVTMANEGAAPAGFRAQVLCANVS
jgi:hypothetical protein